MVCYAKGFFIKAALFGGSFDPPHLGHVSIIEKALVALDIDLLIVIPTYINPFKNSYFAPPALRLQWLTTLCSNFENVEVCDFEINNQKPTPTIDTLNALQLRYNFDENPYIIIGADNVQTLHRWHKYDELEKKAQFVVATRDTKELNPSFESLQVDMPISSSQLRETLDPAWLPLEIKDEIIRYYKGNR